MSVKITQPIPPNVVEIGNEITQGVVDGLMSASPSPSSSNPYLTVNGASSYYLPLSGGTVTGATTFQNDLNVIGFTFSAEDGGVYLGAPYYSSFMDAISVTFNDGGNVASLNASDGVNLKTPNEAFGYETTITAGSLVVGSDTSNGTSSAVNYTNISGGSIYVRTDEPYYSYYSSYGFSVSGGSLQGDETGITFPDSTVQTTAAVSPDLTPYLEKSDNLNSVTNKATARTNLGLAYATDAQVIAGTSASTVITPSLATNNLLNWTVCGTSGIGTNTSVGTVTTSSYGSRCQLTATTAGQYAIVYPSNSAVATYTTSGTGYSDCNYSKRIKIYGRIYVAAVSNINCYFIFGRGIGAPATIGNLSNKGFGIRIQGTGAVELQVHSGTTLGNVTSSFTPSSGIVFDCLIDSLGDGNVNLYINGSLVATSSGGPTGTGGASFPLLIQEISSTGSSTTANFYITGKALYMA